jgi:hypothetical protein
LWTVSRGKGTAIESSARPHGILRLPYRHFCNWSLKSILVSCLRDSAISVIGDWELWLTVGHSGAYWRT